MTEHHTTSPGYGFADHKGYATPAHQDAIRRLGPCAIHRKSFDYIRELCGQYSNLFYSLKNEGAGILTRSELPVWEGRVRESRDLLSPMEYKKLLLMANRRWKRAE